MKKTRGKNVFAENVPYNYPGCQESSGRIMKHRLLAQQIIGRVLTPQECVVRMDGDKNNYDIGNIMVFANQAGARRWSSSANQEFLYRHEDGVYDYDWEKIDAIKATKKQHASDLRKKKHDLIEQIRIWVANNPHARQVDVAKHFDLNKNSVSSFLRHYDIHTAKCDNMLLTYPRNEIIDLVREYKSLNELADFCQMKPANVGSALRRRGISIQNGIQKFKHLDKNKLEQYVNTPGISIVEIARELDTFEENVNVEMKRLGIDTKATAFAFSEGYVMPTEDEYDDTSKVKNVQQIEPIQDEKEDVAEHSYCTLDDMRDALNIKMCDMPLVFHKSMEDIMKSKAFDKPDYDMACDITFARNILTTENVQRLFRVGHTIDDIAKIYDFDKNIVSHIISTLW